MKILSILAVLWLMHGCSLISKAVAEKPEVELREVSVEKISWSSVQLRFDILVDNPNSFTIGLSNLDYQVFIGGKRVGGGNYRQKFEVSGKSKGVVSIPFSLDNQAALEVAKLYLSGAKELKAHVIGTTDFSTPMGGFQIPIDETKVIVKSNS